MPRVLLLLPTTTYRTEAFVSAATRLGVDVTVASEQPNTLTRLNPSGLLTLDFKNPQKAAQRVVEFSTSHPIDAVIHPRPASESRAMNPSDDRFRTGSDGSKHARHPGRVGHVFFKRVIDHPLHPVEVTAGAKRLPVSGQDNGTNFFARAQLLERFGDLEDDLVVEGIVDLGSPPLIGT